MRLVATKALVSRIGNAHSKFKISQLISSFLNRFIQPIYSTLRKNHVAHILFYLIHFIPHYLACLVRFAISSAGDRRA